jgi:hypothetical protein
MVGYTMFSLWLLAQPLVAERGGATQSSAQSAITVGVVTGAAS